MNRRTYILAQLGGVLGIAAFTAALPTYEQTQRREERDGGDTVGRKRVGEDPAFDRAVETITVDDVKVQHVFELDDREGWVKHYVPALGGRGMTIETVRGRVRIQYRAREPTAIT